MDRVKVLFVAFLHGFRWSSSEFDLEIGRPARNGEPGQLLCRKNGKVLNWMRCKSKAIVSAMVCGKEMFWLEIFGFSSCHTIFGASFRGYQFFLLSKMGKNYLSHDFRVWSNIFRQWDVTAAPVAWAWRGNPSQEVGAHNISTEAWSPNDQLLCTSHKSTDSTRVSFVSCSGLSKQNISWRLR